MRKDEALNTLAKVFHNGEEIEGEDGAVMVVDLVLWNEGCEALEELIGAWLGAVAEYRGRPKAQPLQEPVAWCLAYTDPRMGVIHSNPSMYKPELDAISAQTGIPVIPLYTTPQPSAEVEQLTQQRDELLAAIDNLEKQKGRYNTEIAYGRLRDVVGKVKGGK
jgi:hypothetical protein